MELATNLIILALIIAVVRLNIQYGRLAKQIESLLNKRSS